MKTAPFVFWFLPAEWIIGSSALGALLFSILDARGAAVVSLPKGIGAEVVQPPPPITVTFRFEVVDLADTALGQDLWEYRYTVSGLALTANQGFTIFFDRWFLRRLGPAQQSVARRSVQSALRLAWHRHARRPALHRSRHRLLHDLAGANHQRPRAHQPRPAPRRREPARAAK